MSIEGKFKLIVEAQRLQQIVRDIAAAGISAIEVGLIGPAAQMPTSDGRLTVAEAGLINEYGGGSDLGNPPERSFIHAPMERGKGTIGRLLGRMATDIIMRGAHIESAGDDVGRAAAQMMKDTIANSTDLLPNAESTIEKKGFDHPLVENGDLVHALSHRIVRKTGEVIEAGGAIGDYAAFEITAGGIE